MSLYDAYPYQSCGCALCEFIKEYLSNATNWVWGPWCDPRRGYLESEADFLARVPDGFLRWPEEHVSIKKRPWS